MVYDFLANAIVSVENEEYELSEKAKERKAYLEGIFPVTRDYEILVGEEPTKTTSTIIKAMIPADRLSAISYLYTGKIEDVYAIIKEGSCALPVGLQLDLKFKE